MIRRAFLALMAAAGVMTFLEASAHQQKASLTEVLFNTRTGNIEVSHRFVLHDAEEAARVKLGLNGDLFGSSETRAAFASYVDQRFEMVGPDDLPVPLTLIGSEVREGYLWVYQETPIIDGLETIRMRHDVLRDVWPEQVNRVNLKKNGVVKSLVFSDTVIQRTAEFN